MSKDDRDVTLPHVTTCAADVGGGCIDFVVEKSSLAEVFNDDMVDIKVEPCGYLENRHLLSYRQ